MQDKYVIPIALGELVPNVAKSSNRGSAPGERRGGRKKGTRNKKNAALIEAIEKSGITPLEYMLKTMRNPKMDVSRRDDMAKAAAPYVHPRLAAFMAKMAAPGDDWDEIFKLIRPSRGLPAKKAG